MQSIAKKSLAARTHVDAFGGIESAKLLIQTAPAPLSQIEMYVAYLPQTSNYYLVQSCGEVWLTRCYGNWKPTPFKVTLKDLRVYWNAVEKLIYLKNAVEHLEQEQC